MTIRTITFDDEQWQLVPKEATDEMKYVGRDARDGALACKDDGIEGLAADVMHQAYIAMLAAAPEPPAQQPMTYEEIDGTTRAATNAMLDYIYEYGTGAEGSQRFIRRIARAVEAHHGIGKGEGK